MDIPKELSLIIPKPKRTSEAERTETPLQSSLVKAGSKRVRMESETSRPHAKKFRRIKFAPMEDDSTSEGTDIAEADFDIMTQKNVLLRIEHQLNAKYSPVIPRFDEFMEAFRIGLENSDLSLAIQLTFLKTLNLEAHWRALDREYSIGYIKFTVLKSLWTTLISSAGSAVAPDDVDDMHLMFTDAIRTISNSKSTRDAFRSRYDL